jgi:hypothetical protein
VSDADLAPGVEPAMVIDNSVLYAAAEAIEREAAVLAAHLIDGEADEAVSSALEMAQRLRRVAVRAERGRPYGSMGWPAIPVIVQGVVEPREPTCRVCGCTDSCAPECVVAQRGRPCEWVEPDLCSRCAPPRAPSLVSEDTEVP